MEWAQKSGSCIYDGLLLKLYEIRTGRSKREMNSIDRSLYCKGRSHPTFVSTVRIRANILSGQI